MLEILDSIDKSIFLALHHLFRGEVMDGVMWLISDRIVWVPMYIALLLWFFRNKGVKTGIVLVLAILFAVACADTLCARIIRPFVERLRPANPMNPLSDMVHIVNDYRGGPYGFPSCHAANTVMLATFVCLTALRKSLKVWFVIWALLNCLSRVSLGVHYPGDILAGALIGFLFAVLWLRIAEVVLNYLYRKDKPGERTVYIKRNPWDYLVVGTGLLTLLIFFFV